MTLARTPPLEFFIIGYGNPQRRDDGIGPYIVDRLRPIFKHLKKVHLLVRHQLEPDIIDTLKIADRLLFVDASAEALTEGRQWAEVRPELNTMPFLIHQVAPAFILGLLQSLYHRHPQTWIISVAGADFGFGTALSASARKRAEQVIGEITEYILTYTAEIESTIPTQIYRKSEARISKFLLSAISHELSAFVIKRRPT
jgi:hydrogenase maturation protease